MEHIRLRQLSPRFYGTNVNPIQLFVSYNDLGAHSLTWAEEKFFIIKTRTQWPANDLSSSLSAQAVDDKFSLFIDNQSNPLGWELVNCMRHQSLQFLPKRFVRLRQMRSKQKSPSLKKRHRRLSCLRTRLLGYFYVSFNIAFLSLNRECCEFSPKKKNNSRNGLLKPPLSPSPNSPVRKERIYVTRRSRLRTKLATEC